MRISYFRYIFIGLFFVLLISCGISTEELAKNVQETYISNWEERGLNITVTKHLMLVKKNKTEYTGLMTVSINGISEQVRLNVIFDGKTWTSQVD